MGDAVDTQAKRENAPWGTPAKGAVAWQCHRSEQGKWTACHWYEASTGVAARSWPLSLLSVQTIGDRWGAGRYRLTWEGSKPAKGKRLAVGTSAVFIIDGFPARPVYPNAPPPKAEAAPEPAAVSGVEVVPLALLEKVMGMTTAENRRVLEAASSNTAQMLAFMTTAHTQQLQNQREHHEAMLKVVQAQAKKGEADSELVREFRALRAEVAALKSSAEVDDEDEDDDGPEKSASEKLLSGLAGMVEEVGPAAARAACVKLGILKDDE